MLTNLPFRKMESGYTATVWGKKKAGVKHPKQDAHFLLNNLYLKLECRSVSLNWQSDVLLHPHVLQRSQTSYWGECTTHCGPIKDALDTEGTLVAFTYLLILSCPLPVTGTIQLSNLFPSFHSLQKKHNQGPIAGIFAEHCCSMQRIWLQSEVLGSHKLVTF